MKISVLVTVYNNFELLYKCLLSLCYQSVLPHEVVVSDDGSDEDILELLKPLVTRLPFHLRFISQPHAGFRASKVRNNAVRFSTGDYLIFLDQDIIGKRNFVETFVKHAKPRLFLVSWPVRLTPEQTAIIDEPFIRRNDFESLVHRMQKKEFYKQFRKDLFYFSMYSLHLRKIGPKLRSGLFSVFRNDLFMVNGFDEKYQGWGNEDDDLGHRLHVAGIRGKNPFSKHYPLHLYHEPNRIGTQRTNLTYYRQRLAEIHQGDFRAERGLVGMPEENHLRKIQLN